MYLVVMRFDNIGFDNFKLLKCVFDIIKIFFFIYQINFFLKF